MRTIAVVNAKGGCGKTTIATSLAAALAWEGHAVALGDLDPQQSASDWLSLRPDSAPQIMDARSSRGRVRAPAGTDTLILDTPAGLAGTELGNLVRRAQTIILPILPSPVDMRAGRRFIHQLLELKPIKQGEVKLGLVANRVRPNTIIFRELTGFLDGFRVPVVAHLRASMNYVRAFERGLAVADLPSWQAWQDWNEWEVLLQWLRSGESQGKR